jgi:hypothetical protein
MEATPAMGPWELPETRGGMSRRNRRNFTRRLSKALPPPDREVLAEVTADPQRWASFIDDTGEAFRQGGAGVRADLALARGGGGGGADFGRPAHGPAAGPASPTRGI